MDIKGKKLVVIGGAGLIGSHTVDKLIREDVGEIVIFDNFARGSLENLEAAMKDPRVRIYEAGGDICQTDILNAALNDPAWLVMVNALGAEVFRTLIPADQPRTELGLAGLASGIYHYTLVGAQGTIGSGKLAVER